MITFKQLKENIDEINETGVGYIISYSLFMIAQMHLWHLLCPTAQQHIALGEFYDELQSEVDELAERFIAQGGILSNIIDEPLIANYDEYLVMEKFNQFRNMVTSAIDTNSRMASIVDGVVDIQELIDNKLYKFKLK